jgi:hypothetical protein
LSGPDAPVVLVAVVDDGLPVVDVVVADAAVVVVVDGAVVVLVDDEEPHAARSPARATPPSSAIVREGVISLLSHLRPVGGVIRGRRRRWG